MLTNILNKKNLLSILPYLGIFFVLFMGSGLVKIPLDSVWLYVIKFGIIAAVIGIGVSAWWKAKKNNEPPTDYLKLALFVPFTIDFHLHFAFIFLTIILFNKKLLLPWNSPLKPIYLLFIWGFISYVINQFIEFNPLSFPLFALFFFSTFIFWGLTYNSASKIDITSIKAFFYNVIIVMTGIILCQIVFLNNLHPDNWHGGTGDAHDASLFLSVAFILISSEFLNNNSKKKSRWNEIIILLVTFPIFFFNDSKAFFVLTLLSFFVLLLIRLEKTIFRLTYVLVLTTLFILWYNITDGKLPISIINLNQNVYYLDEYPKSFVHNKKAELIVAASRTFKEDPIVAILGGGPGTFLSSTAILKKFNGSYEVNNRKYAKFKKLRNSLKEIFLPLDSWIKIKYAGANYEKSIMSMMTDWRSSIINIFFEFGIIGFFMILYFIIQQFRFGLKSYKIDKQIGFLNISFIILISALFYLSNWGESIKFGMCIYLLLGYYTVSKLKIY